MRTSIVILVSCVLLALHQLEARPNIFTKQQGEGLGIVVTPPEVFDYTSPLYVHWSGVENVADSDVIVFKLGPADAKTPLPVDDDRMKTIGHYPVKWFPGYQLGSGTISVPVWHPRDGAFFFEYHRNGTGTLEYVTGSPAIPAANVNFASQFRIAFTHSDTEMRVSYTTFANEKALHYVQISTESFLSLSSSTAQFPGAYRKACTHHHCVMVSTKNDKLWGYDGRVTHDRKTISVVRQYETSSEKSYTIEEMREAPANTTKSFVAPGNFRTAVLSDLKYHTKYYYRVIDENLQPLSLEYSFVSSPPVGSNLETEVFAFGDLGVTNPFYTKEVTQIPAQNTVNAIKEQMYERIENNRQVPTMLLHIGDLSYSRGNLYLWEIYMRQMEPLTAMAGYMVSIGNHEYDYMEQPWKPKWSDFTVDSGGEAGVPYSTRYHMPTDYLPYPYVGQTPMHEDEEKLRNIAYSFEFGTVHYLIYSCEHDFTKDSAQYKFIEQDLKNVNRTRTPFVVLATHRPMYCSIIGCSLYYKHKDLMDTYIQEALEPLYKQYQVDLNLMGHVHVYERYQPMYNYTVSKPGSTDTIHVVIGMAGHVFQPGWAPSNMYIGPKYKEPREMTKLNSDFSHAQPETIAFRSMNYGFTKFTANRTHLVFRYYGNISKKVHDEFVIVKNL